MYVDDVRIFEPHQHDVQAEALAPDGEIVFPGTVLTPRVTVKNVGLNTETFDVNLTISLNGVEIRSETQAAANLEPDSLTTVAFTDFTTEEGNYFLEATTLLVGDLEPANDAVSSKVDCWTLERTPFMVLYTEWGCGPCVDANQGLDAWYPAMGNDASVLRVHVDWPSGSDPLYWANPEQCDFLLEMAPVTIHAVPWPFSDNRIDGYEFEWPNWNRAWDILYDASRELPAPLVMESGYWADTGTVVVDIDHGGYLDPAADCRLFVAITEDNVLAEGPNGELYHSQTFRWLFPGTAGLPIDPTVGLNHYQVSVTLDGTWVFENLRAVAWVQDYPGGLVLNSSTSFLSEGAVSVDEGDAPALAARLTGAQPNPFNPLTTVRFAVPRTQRVTLTVYSLGGQRVTTLVDAVYEAGEHPVTWDGTDDRGREVGSGTYIVQMRSEQNVSAAKIVLVR